MSSIYRSISLILLGSLFWVGCSPRISKEEYLRERAAEIDKFNWTAWQHGDCHKGIQYRYVKIFEEVPTYDRRFLEGAPKSYLIRNVGLGADIYLLQIKSTYNRIFTYDFTVLGNKDFENEKITGIPHISQLRNTLFKPGQVHKFVIGDPIDGYVFSEEEREVEPISLRVNNYVNNILKPLGYVPTAFKVQNSYTGKFDRKLIGAYQKLTFIDGAGALEFVDGGIQPCDV